MNIFFSVRVRRQFWGGGSFAGLSIGPFFNLGFSRGGWGGGMPWGGMPWGGMPWGGYWG